MRVVGSPTYLRERSRRRLAAAAVLAGAGALIFLLSIGIAETLGEVPTWVTGLPAFGGLAGMLFGGLRALSATKDRAGSAAEGPVLAQLTARLSDDYLYLRHVLIPGRNVEADGILLGPHGALVLALRAMEGQFRVRGHDWFAVDEDGDERAVNDSPTWQLVRPLRAVERFANEHGLGDVPIKGAVVLVSGRLLDASLPGSAVVPVDRIATYVDYLRDGTAAPQASVQTLASKLEPLAARVN